MASKNDEPTIYEYRSMDYAVLCHEIMCMGMSLSHAICAYYYILSVLRIAL